ncbi:hypothetical protein GCM10009554_51270 [Kribbella koreensis]|uniref:FAD/NAD(P)-binding domain-containing protein n=1 Tax=Kribbella koreensis TaxID=57909 RepID=A0ABP4BGL6_9ACTN
MSPHLRSTEGDPAEPRPGEPFSITLDGQPLEALPGQTVAAALMATGRDSWRTTRAGDNPRGVFCGIGSCFDCLVVVNGLPDVRACQRVVRPDDAITTQPGAALPAPAPHPDPPPTPPPPLSPPPSPSPSGPVDGHFVLGVSVSEQGKRSDGAQSALGNGVQAVPVVVVGAGPAGMSAAVAAADAGASVLLIDAAPSVGGQFNRQLPDEFRARRPERLQHGWSSFTRLRDRIANDPRITHLTETSVWSLERPATAPAATTAAPAGTAATSSAAATSAAATSSAATSSAGTSAAGASAAGASAAGVSAVGATGVAAGQWTRVWLQTGAADSAGRRVWAVGTSALVLATGAYDRVLPFPGWDLPGVYSAGAAQALAKGQRIAVGSRVLVAGTGPFLLPVAESLLGVGAEVVGLLEANKPSTVLRGWLTDPLAASTKLTEGLGYATLLARHRIPFHHGRTVVAAHGTDRVEAVTTARLGADWTPIPGTEERVEVDAVCLGFGFTPNLELAVSARCTLGTGPDGGPAVLVDEDQQTTTPGIYAAGELTGIGGANLAAAEGHLAGLAAAGGYLAGLPAAGGYLAGLAAAGASDRGGISPVPGSGLPPNGAISLPGRATTGRRRVARGKRLAAALAAAYPVRGGWLEWSAAATLVCRCEEVSRGELEEAVGERDVVGERTLKLSSRAGLGMCQGRVCGRNVSALCGVENGYGRPIGVPVRMRDLAAADVLEDL